MGENARSEQVQRAGSRLLAYRHTCLSEIVSTRKYVRLVVVMSISNTHSPSVLPRTRIRRFQFSMRALLLFVGAFALMCGWLGITRRGYQHEQYVISQIRESTRDTYAFLVVWPQGFAGCGTSVNGILYTETFVPDWLEPSVEMLGIDIFDRVTEAVINGDKIDETVIDHLGKLDRLHRLTLFGTNVTIDVQTYLKERLPNCAIQINHDDA